MFWPLLPHPCSRRRGGASAEPRTSTFRSWYVTGRRRGERAGADGESRETISIRRRSTRRLKHPSSGFAPGFSRATGRPGPGAVPLTGVRVCQSPTSDRGLWATPMCDLEVVTVDFQEVVYEVAELVLGARTMVSPSNVACLSCLVDWVGGRCAPLLPATVVVFPLDGPACHQGMLPRGGSSAERPEERVRARGKSVAGDGLVSIHATGLLVPRDRWAEPDPRS
jgi:hypothetical protein